MTSQTTRGFGPANGLRMGGQRDLNLKKKRSDRPLDDLNVAGREDVPKAFAIGQHDVVHVGSRGLFITAHWGLVS